MRPPAFPDTASEIDFSASCVIDTASDDGAWADALKFPPFADSRPIHNPELDDA